MGKIHSLESFGAVDGPGIRFVVFMQGCPMRCAYCHNPDTWCIGDGKDYSVADLMGEIMKYKHYYGNDGGVTVSGGEPLVQIDFVIELFEALKKENIGTCIDTSGILFDRNNNAVFNKYKKLLSLTDLVLLDIKHLYEDNHKKLTGQSNKNILDFAKFLDEENVPVWIRHVLVPGYTDDTKHLQDLREFIDTLHNVQKVEVLPYHTLGVSKYEQLGITYPLAGVPAPTKKQMGIANTILIKGDKRKWETNGANLKRVHGATKSM